MEKENSTSRCDTLLMAVVQAQDAEQAENELHKLGFTVIRLPSVGAFLGRRNATLFIGLPSIRQAEAIETLQKNCRQRTEYIAVPLESAPLPLPSPTPIVVGGATVFEFQLEHFEEV
ncbi:MAG TPA: cyclic-di-AMP receptor [Longilinea sp.]|nr:cyclic-di-AMP receptor [Longilinea sp.]